MHKIAVVEQQEISDEEYYNSWRMLRRATAYEPHDQYATRDFVKWADWFCQTVPGSDEISGIASIGTSTRAVITPCDTIRLSEVTPDQLFGAANKAYFKFQQLINEYGDQLRDVVGLVEPFKVNAFSAYAQYRDSSDEVLVLQACLGPGCTLRLQIMLGRSDTTIDFEQPLNSVFRSIVKYVAQQGLV